MRPTSDSLWQRIGSWEGYLPMTSPHTPLSRAVNVRDIKVATSRSDVGVDSEFKAESLNNRAIV